VRYAGDFGANSSLHRQPTVGSNPPFRFHSNVGKGVICIIISHNKCTEIRYCPLTCRDVSGRKPIGSSAFPRARARGKPHASTSRKCSLEHITGFAVNWRHGILQLGASSGDWQKSLRSIRTKRLQERESIHVRHYDIERNQIGIKVGARVERVPRIRNPQDPAVPVSLQKLFQ